MRLTMTTHQLHQQVTRGTTVAVTPLGGSHWDSGTAEAPVLRIHPDEMRQLLTVQLQGLSLHAIDPQIGAAHAWQGPETAAVGDPRNG